MEQKKILWIVVLVASCLLVIFGVAIVVYGTSRSTGTSNQQAAAYTPAVSTANAQERSQIDPDKWTREPGAKPGLDVNQTPTQGNINLTIVNGDNAGANYGTMDVSGLTSGTSTTTLQTADGTLLPAIPGQDNRTTVIQNGTNDTAKAGVATDTTGQAAKTTSTKAVDKNVAAAKPAATKTAAPVKAVAKKTVTEYWIQTGSFSSKLNAEKARESLTARFLTAEIFTKTVAGATAFRVRVGPYKSKSEADYWLGTIKEIPDFTGSYVSEVKTKK